MVGAQLLPAGILLAGILGLIAPASAITAALALALAEVLVAVLYAARRAQATTVQAATSVMVALAFAVVITLLKIFVHS